MGSYSPFSKPLNKLTGKDLERLYDVNEGWYVEYKREVPNASAIAKSVSAFANTYGGWLFYGVAEKSKVESVAGELVGVVEEDLDATLQKIRQACASSLNPTPHFEVKVVKFSPSQDANKSISIVCVEVPQSLTAPHVHRDGRIYRRVADGSEPKPENDRFFLDQLWARGKKVKKVFKKWEKRDPHLSKAEKNSPYMRILITPHLWSYRDFEGFPNLEEMRSLFINEPQTKTVPLDTIFRNQAGYTMRQCVGKDPHNITYTWQVTNDLASDIVVPLYLLDGISEVERYSFSKYKFGDEFLDLLECSLYERPRVLDLNAMFLMVRGIITQVRGLMGLMGLEPYFSIKVRLVNCWRAVPFYDVDFVMDSIKKNGIPMILHDTVSSPEGVGPDSFWNVVEPNENGVDGCDEKIIAMVQAISAFCPISQAFGLPFVTELERKSEGESVYDKFYAAAERSIEVAEQRRRLREA